MIKTLRFFSALFIFIISAHSVNAQTVQGEIQEKLEDYFSIGKEVAYLHLNKSILLQGEQLGFSAYIVNKLDLTPSISTTNLYVQVKNSAEKIIQEELLLVENGVTSGVINIDEAFAPGDYTITAFTNWMRNFEEQNYFTEKIKVLSTSSDNAISTNTLPVQIDAQFLPESGHLLHGIVNTVGVIVKDKNGYGLQDAKVLLMDSEEQTVANITLNQVGIGKFAFIPNIEENYTAVVTYSGKDYPVDVNINIEKQGIILSANQRDSHLRLLVQTNPEYLANLQGRTFVLTVQGRKALENHSILFENKNAIPFELDLNDLDAGVNIITLFDETGRPVAERLFFNYNGLPMESLKETRVVKQQDSLEVNFSFAGSKNRSLSVSILPKNSISNKRHHNILSYNFLQPYLRGVVENGGWYFEDVDQRKKYEMDNLLITQGWSSYDWENIFSKGIAFEHNFEENFELKAKLNRGRLARNEMRFLVHATANSPILFLDVPKDHDEFIFEGIIPIEGEKLALSRIKNNDDLVPAGVSISSTPNKIPNFRSKAGSLVQSPQILESRGKISVPAYIDDFIGDAEDLGEVSITAVIDKEKERERRLSSKSWGRVSVIGEKEMMLFQTLAEYLRSKNFRVIEELGTFTVSSSLSGATGSVLNAERMAGDEPGPPVYEDDPLRGIMMYLDDMVVNDHSIFYNYPLATIDYIEINRTGMGSGMVGSKGSIKIYSDFTLKHSTNVNRNRIQEFDLPLTYSRKKSYYTPQYENTRDSFFQQYGVIDWKSNLQSYNGEDIAFQIKSPEVDFQMIIEGIAEDGTLIHEITTFSANE